MPDKPKRPRQYQSAHCTPISLRRMCDGSKASLVIWRQSDHVCFASDGSNARIKRIRDMFRRLASVWVHFAAVSLFLSAEASMASAAGLANPAAEHCVAIGGVHDLQTSMCTLPDGSDINAWQLLHQAPTASTSIANPAATYCITVGGAYEIRDGENGKFGICRLPDGTEKEAWAFFRQNN